MFIFNFRQNLTLWQTWDFKWVWKFQIEAHYFFWCAPFGHIYYLYYFHLLNETGSAWLWHNFHLVLDEIWTYDPRSWLEFVTRSTWHYVWWWWHKQIFMHVAYLLPLFLWQIHNKLTNILRWLSEPVEPNSRNNFRTSGSPRCTLYD